MRGSSVALIFLVVIVALAGCAGLLSVRRVDPGNAGVIIHYRTDGQTVVEPVPTGTIKFINIINQRFVEYPISQQTLTMVQSTEEGDVKGDDSVKCQDHNGVLLNIDSSVLWKVDPIHVGDLYLLRPGMPLVNNPGADISSIIVRREVRTAITLACSKYRYDEMLGDNRSSLNNDVEQLLAPELAKMYIILDSVQIAEIHLPQEQQDAITRVSIAQQAAREASFAAEKARNEADAAIATAEGQRQVAILAAEGEAESIRIINEQLAQSPDYIKYLYALNWDGKLPTTLVITDSNGNPLLTLPLGSTGVGTTPTPVPNGDDNGGGH